MVDAIGRQIGVSVRSHRKVGIALPETAQVVAGGHLEAIVRVRWVLRKRGAVHLSELLGGLTRRPWGHMRLWLGRGETSLLHAGTEDDDVGGSVEGKRML